MHIRILLCSICFLCSFPLAAQLCQGQPGPVIYAEGFGSGPNDGPALPPGVTTYNYGSIWPGNYRVTNTTGLNGDVWHNSPDHTPGDTDGYLLLFDASADAGLFFQKQLDNLCSDTRYEFSCWVMNVEKPVDCGGNGIPPDIRFELRHPVSGAVLGQTTTGPIFTTDSPVWSPFAMTFFLPSGLTSIQVRLINNAQGGCGNDLAIDDFAFRLCNPRTTQQITICAGESFSAGNSVYTQPGIYTEIIPIDQSCNDSIVITDLSWFNSLVNQYVILCQGESVQVGNHVYSETGTYLDTIEKPGCDSIISTAVVVGNPDTTLRTIRICAGDSIRIGHESYTQTGVIEQRLHNMFGCDSTVITSLEVGMPLTMQVVPDTMSLELGETAQLQVISSAQTGIVWDWQPPQGLSCSDCPDPVAQPVAGTVYVVTATDTDFGCSASDTVAIAVQRCRHIYIPNIFSPDAAGANDRFTVFSGPCVSLVRSMRVFDRWGNLVFERTDFPPNEPAMGWDGRVSGKYLNSGVFTYLIETELLDGFRQRYSGDVMLMR